MPKRVLDFDALWASDKLASCAEWAQSEYAWLYGLADASGSFEITNLRVIWGRVAAIRKNLSLKRLQAIFDEFIARGLLFAWEENGKRYGHWTGSDVPGRLPAPSWRVRLEKLAPPVPPEALAAYSARFGGSKEGVVLRACAGSRNAEPGDAQARGLKHGLEEAQGQDWDLSLDSEKDLEQQVCLPPQCIQNRREEEPVAAPHFSEEVGATSGTPEIPAPEYAAECAAAELLEIYERERGELPPAGALTAERRRKCARWLAGGFTAEEFRAAVRRAAATPFLAGDGNRGWQASFDWLIANRSNARKVLEGEYAPQGRAHAARPHAERHVPADLYTGIGPRAADCGVRVNPAALERIRARGTCLGRKKAFFGSTTAELRGGEGQSPETAPAPAAFDADSRASPSLLKS